MTYWLIILSWFSGLLCSYGQDGFIEGRPRLAYWKVGQNKEIVIVLHGGGGAQHQYLRPEFDALSQTAQVIYYDQRGCGKSDTAITYVWQHQVADLKRLISTLATSRKVFLAGSSWGSMLATLYAYTYPQDVKGLILSGTMPWYGEEQDYHREVFLPTKVVKLTMKEKRIVTTAQAGGRPVQDTIDVAKEVELYSGLPQSEPLSSRISAPKAERLKQIQTPVLLFNGTYDREWDWAEEYAKLLPNLQVRTLPEAGHDSWFSSPELFFSYSNEFIRQISK